MRKITALFLLFLIGIAFLIPNSIVGATVMPYTIEDITFVNQDGVSLSALNPGDTAYIRVTACKTDTTTTPGKYVIGLYDSTNNILQQVFVKTYNMAVGEIRGDLIPFTVPNNFYSCYVKAFVLDSLNDIRPQSSIKKQTLKPYVTVRGTVTAKRFSTVSNASVYKDDEVSLTIEGVYQKQENGVITYPPISNTVYGYLGSTFKLKVGNTNAKDLLGYAVTANICNLGEVDATIMEITPREGLNKTVTISAENFKTLPNVSGRFDYWTDKDNDKFSSITLASTISYFLNGVQDGTYNSASSYGYKFINFGNDGSITFLDSNNDGLYEIAFANKYLYTVVSDISKSSFKIIGKPNNSMGISDGYLNSIILNYTNPDYSIEFIKNGQKAKFDDIKAGDVLSIAGKISSDNKLEYGKVYISSNSTMGQINEIIDMDYVNYMFASKVVIDGVIYKTVPKLANIGASQFIYGIFYTNIDGKIIMSEAKPYVNRKLAFVTKVGSNGGIASSFDVRLLTTQGEWKTLQMASKVEINGYSGIDPITGLTKDIPFTPMPTAFPTNFTPTKWSEVLPDGLGTRRDGDYFSVYSVVAYETNIDNKISKINFKPIITSTNSDSSFYAQNLTGQYSYTYMADTKKFSGINVYVNSDTNIFTIESSSWTSRYNISEDRITTMKADALYNNEGYSLIYAYNKSIDNVASCLVGLGINMVTPMPTPTDYPIVTPIQTATTGKLAFVTKIGPNMGLTPSYDVRILTKQGKWETLQIANKVEINGYPGIDPITGLTRDIPVAPMPTVYPTNNVPTKWSEVLPDGLATYRDGENYSIYNIIEYETNIENKISKINFKPIIANTHSTNNFYAQNLSQMPYTYTAYNKKLSGVDLFMWSGTALFTIDTYSWSSRYNLPEDKISVVDTLSDQQSYTLAYAYNKDANNYASAIVGLKLDFVITDVKPFMIISSKSNVYNNGEIITKIEGYEAGVKKSFTLKSTDVTVSGIISSADSLQIGDVIHYTLSADGNAKTIIARFRSANQVNTFAALPFSSYYNVFSLEVIPTGYTQTKIVKYVYGYVRNKAGALTLVANDSITLSAAGDNIFPIASGAYVTKYNKLNAATTAGYVVASDAGEIEADTIVDAANTAQCNKDGDFVFARVEDGIIKDMVIIKRNLSN